MSRALVALERWPDAAPALAWPGGALDFRQLRACTAALARAAGTLGEPGSPLAVISASRHHLALGVLAALRLDRPALPLDPARSDLASCLEACAPGGALADPGLELPAGLPCSNFAAAEDTAAFSSAGSRPPVAARPAPAAPSSGVALLVPTSGTAGQARVAMLSGAALDAHAVASAKVLPALGPGDCWLVCLPMTSIGALAALWRTLSAGACLAFLERFDAGAARELMAAGTSHVSVVPAMIGPLAETRAAPPAGLRCLLSGGGSLSATAASAAESQRWPLWNAWGMTESAAHVAAGPVDEHWEEGIVGRPLPGATIHVDPVGGRLRLAGPMLMSGYARPGLAPGEGLQDGPSFLSGDLGGFLPDGRLRVLGRADDVIVSGGVNIHPQAVEAVLATCPGAGEVAVASRPDPRWGSVLVALYTGEASPESLEAWARDAVPSSSRPRLFLRVPALPRNAMGKLLRHRLSALCASALAPR
jgi:O-succinylbenzoic acid--CoA ligase